jgi:hypothetical protein
MALETRRKKKSYDYLSKFHQSTDIEPFIYELRYIYMKKEERESI